MGTRNNPSPGGLRPGLEATNRRTRKEPVKSKLATVANSSNAGDEVATKNDSNDEEPLAMSIEKQETRTMKSTSTRRHNTRSTSRSVSPSLLNNGFTERKEDSKAKGKGRARSPSASSNHSGVKAKGARGPKRNRAFSEDEEDRDTVDEKPSKRVKSKIHKDHADRPVGEPVSRKRNLRNQIHDSPIPEVPEEEEFIDNRVKRTKPIPQHELQFSYAPILAKYPPQPSKQPSQHDEEPTLQLEPASTRTPHSTSNELALIPAPAEVEYSQESTSNELALVPAPAEAEYSQQPEPTSSQTPKPYNNELALVPAPAEAEYSQRSDATPKLIEFTEQRAICDAPTSSTPQQPVVERTDAQSNGRRSGTRDVVQQRSTPRNRSASTPPLPTLKHPQPSNRATATLNGSPVLRQGLMDTRVAQGSARKDRAELPSGSTTRKPNLHENYDKPRSRVRHPYTKAILSTDPMPIFEDSEHEDDSENEEVPKRADMDEHKAWKYDLHVAKSTLVKVLKGQRLPDAGSSIDGMDPRITRRKPGETPKAPRQRENNIPVPTPPASNYLIIQGRFEEKHFVLTRVQNIDELIEASKWSQEKGNSLTEAIEFFEASKSRKTNRVRSAAPSPASQRGNSQPPSMSSFHRNPSTPREVPGATRSASLQLSNGEVAVRRSEMDEAVEDDESTGSFDEYEEKNDKMSRNTSEVTADEATLILPTTPTMTPSQQAPEPRAWSSVLTTVKKAVYTPFKFFGRTPNAAEAATTNLDKPEFTFSHSHKPAQPLTTPSRSSKQHAMPHSERRGNTNNVRRRVSFQARVPQTERQRRHVDRSTPLHLRGVPSARDMQDLRDQQASTRQRKRDEDMASLEENELSHGKTFRAPSPSSESDDEEDNTTTMTDDNDEPTSPPRKTEYAFLPQTVQPAQKVSFEAESSANTGRAKTIDFSLTNPRPSLNFPTAAKIPAAQAAQAKESSITNPVIKAGWERFQVPSENGDSPYYYVHAKDQWRGQYYRKVHKTNPDEKFYNMFGTEAFWFRLPGDVFVELNHNEEPGLRAGGPINPGFVRWSRWMEKPHNLAKEKKALLAKWEKVPNSQKPLLLPGIRPFYKKLMEIGEFALDVPSSTGTASASGTSSNTTSGTSSAATSSGTATASGVSSNSFSSTPSAATSNGTASASGMSSNIFSGTATASGVSSNIFSGTPSAATSGGTNSAANPSGTYKFPEDDETEGDGDDVEPDVADQAQFQTPPPKPRPGNAQLPQSQPQPTPARAALAAALANVNKHRPNAPSNLRNVTQMSPLQQPDQENLGVNGITTNETRNTKETISRGAIIQTEDELREQAAAEEAVMTPEERTRQLDQVYRDLMAIPEDALPVFILPKAPKMRWDEEGYDQDEINAATEAAFETNNGGY